MTQTFGKFIREIREKKFKLREFAMLTGLSPAFISQMERGISTAPGEESVIRMAQLLERNQDELLALSGRIPSDIVEIILKDPVDLCELIRKHSQTPKKTENISYP